MKRLVAVTVAGIVTLFLVSSNPQWSTRPSWESTTTIVAAPTTTSALPETLGFDDPAADVTTESTTTTQTPTTQAPTTQAPTTQAPTTQAPTTRTPTTRAPTTTTQAPTTQPATTTTAAPSGDHSSEAENSFLSKINALRGSVGVGTLSMDADLRYYARNWSTTLPTNFAHSNLANIPGWRTTWRTAGENIAYVCNSRATLEEKVQSAFNGLRNSDGHYRNMVNGNFTHVGIGVWVVDSCLWTTHVFAG